MWPGMWVTSRTGSGGWAFWEKPVSWVLPSEEEGWLSLPRRGLVSGGHVLGGGRWKSKHRKMVCLSLCWKTFKLKGNKKFRTWTKKSQVLLFFLCFGIPMLRIYVSYEHYMYISRNRISGYVKTGNKAALLNTNNKRGLMNSKRLPRTVDYVSTLYSLQYAGSVKDIEHPSFIYLAINGMNVCLHMCQSKCVTLPNFEKKTKKQNNNNKKQNKKKQKTKKTKKTKSKKKQQKKQQKTKKTKNKKKYQQKKQNKKKTRKWQKTKKKTTKTKKQKTKRQKI